MKMSHLVSRALLALALTAPFASAYAADDASGNLNFIAGQKWLDKGDWEPIEQQRSFGISVNYEPEGWWCGATFDVLNGYSSDTNATGRLTSDTWEFDVGPKKVFKIPNVPIRAYVGGGYAYISATVKNRISSSRSEGSGSGAWASTGLFVTLANKINLGIEARYSSAQVTVDGNNLDAGGTNVGAIVGFHFQ